MTRNLLAIAATVAALVLPALAQAQDLARGEEIYGLCTQCHGTAGAGDPLSLAPSIAGKSQWYLERQLHNFKQGLRGTHPDDLGGLRMYPMSRSLRSDEDIAAVAAYVASLPVPDLEPTIEGDAAKGQASYATCQACHGPEGAGNEALNAPRLTHTSDWYLVQALRKYQAGILGGNPGNQNAVMMRGMALSLADDQAIFDVVAYIRTLEK
ncbi:MAG: c-type cytochrome [Myxococcota bacterium]